MRAEFHVVAGDALGYEVAGNQLLLVEESHALQRVVGLLVVLLLHLRFFTFLDGIKMDKLQQWGENLHQRVKREVGMPISIGLAPTKTLAKIASKLAKKYEVYKHCCMIDMDYKREKALEWCPIEDGWGIGRRYAAKLQSLGCKTALDFAKHHKDWVRLTFNNINMVCTWQEQNEEDAVPNEELAPKKHLYQSLVQRHDFQHRRSEDAGV